MFLNVLPFKYTKIRIKSWDLKISTREFDWALPLNELEGHMGIEKEDVSWKHSLGFRDLKKQSSHFSVPIKLQVGSLIVFYLHREELH